MLMKASTHFVEHRKTNGQVGQSGKDELLGPEEWGIEVGQKEEQTQS